MRTIIIGFTLFLAGWVNAQDEVSNQIVSALNTGNANALSKHFTSSLDLTVLSNEDIYPADQAEKIIASFFAKHPPIDFTLKHKGTSKLDDQYRIGDLETKQGTYRVTFFIRNTDKGKKIKQFRIEEFDDDF